MIATITASQKATHSVQAITTDLHHNNQIQIITINNTQNKINKNKNSTFILYIDLTTYGYGLQSTAPIFFDSVPMRENEISGRKKIPLGEMVGESFQSKIENIAGLKLLNITGESRTFYIFYTRNFSLCCCCFFFRLLMLIFPSVYFFFLSTQIVFSLSLLPSFLFSFHFLCFLHLFFPFHSLPSFVSLPSVFVSIDPQDTEKKNKNQRIWSVTFNNADYNLPLLSCSNESAVKNNLIQIDNRIGTMDTIVLTQNNGNSGIFANKNDVYLSTRYSYLQYIQGSFSITLGGTKIVLKSDISAVDLGSILESIPVISAVGVDRQRNGLDGGFIWTVTFYALVATEIGTILLHILYCAGHH